MVIKFVTSESDKNAVVHAITSGVKIPGPSGVLIANPYADPMPVTVYASICECTCRNENIMKRLAHSAKNEENRERNHCPIALPQNECSICLPKRESGKS